MPPEASKVAYVRVPSNDIAYENHERNGGSDDISLENANDFPLVGNNQSQHPRHKMAVGLGNKNRPPPIPFLPGYPANNGGANVVDAAAASSLPVQELDVPSPVSGTSPSSPCYMLPLPPASSAASSPTSQMGSPMMTMSVNLVSTSEATYPCAAAAAGRRPSMTPSLGAAGGGANDHGQSNYFSQPGPSNSDQPTTPLLSRYDPYHGVSCYVHHPFSQRPLSGDEVKDSLQKALIYGASQLAWKLNYQDFSPKLEGLDNGSLRSGETFR